MASRKEVAQRREWLRAEILQKQTARGAQAGDMLPPVRELAARHGLSHRVVFQELQKLVKDGALETVPRVGTFLKGDASTPSARSFMNQAIAVVGMNDVGPGGWHDQQTGWSAFVALGALAAIQGIEDARYHTVILNPDRLCGEVVERLAAEPPRGVVIGELNEVEQSIEWARAFRENRIPVVVSTDAPGAREFDRAVHDHEAGSYDLTLWMIRQGRRRIVNLWPAPATSHWYEDRQRGYERAMIEAGLRPEAPVRAPYGVADATRDSFDRATQRLAEFFRAETRRCPADAYLLASDGLVPATGAALRAMGLPEVLLAGYDAYWKETIYRPLESIEPEVTVDKRNTEIGAEMVRVLLDRQQGLLDRPPIRRVVPHTIVDVRR